MDASQAFVKWRRLEAILVAGSVMFMVDALSFSAEKVREAFKVVYLSRGRYRTTRRDLQSSLRLGALARELSSSYLEVVEWKGWKRTLALKI